MVTALQTKKETLAKQIGEKSENIRTVKSASVHAMESGVIIEIHIRRWRGRSHLDFSDLGLPQKESDKIYAHLLNLGSKKLLPKAEGHAGRQGRDISYVDVLDYIDGRARRWLDIHSLKTHWGQFVPYTMYADWKKGNEEIKEEYFKIRDELKSNYKHVLSDLMSEYHQMAEAAYVRAKALSKTQMSKEAYVEKFMQYIKASVPSAETIYNSFDYETVISFVPLPSDLERDIARAEKIRTTARLATEADRAKLTSIKNMNDDILKQMKDKKGKMVDSFFADVQRQLSTLMYDSCTDVLESIKRNEGKLRGGTSLKLTNLISAIHALNFYGDASVDTMIDKVKKQMQAAPIDRDVNEIAKTLKNIGTLTRVTLLSLGEEPRAVRGLGIPNEPTPEFVRQTRRELGITEEMITLTKRMARELN